MDKQPAVDSLDVGLEDDQLREEMQLLVTVMLAANERPGRYTEAQIDTMLGLDGPGSAGQRRPLS